MSIETTPAATTVTYLPAAVLAFAVLMLLTAGALWFAEGLILSRPRGTDGAREGSTQRWAWRYHLTVVSDARFTALVAFVVAAVVGLGLILGQASPSERVWPFTGGERWDHTGTAQVVDVSPGAYGGASIEVADDITFTVTDAEQALGIGVGDTVTFTCAASWWPDLTAVDGPVGGCAIEPKEDTS